MFTPIVREKILVHVIVPSGIHFEYQYYKGTPHKSILNDLAIHKAQLGVARNTEKVLKSNGRVVGSVFYEDHSSGFRYDDPNTIVAIGEEVDGEFVEKERLKGPPLTTSSPEIDYPII